tara:strand:+ start:485 stop:1213 length:729 start_codon:yes stop_codon:yes gene_type:complete
MKKIPVWDIPIRLFHWAFTLCILIALIIALFVDDDSTLFSYHIFFGLSAGFLLVIRLIIAIIGTRYARLSGLFFSPSETFKYFLTSINKNSRKYVGHNPGSATAALIMFIMVIGLLISGLNIESEFMEEVHPIFAYVLLGVILLHLSGIILYTINHKENIALSMIDGKKVGLEEFGINNSQGIIGLVLTIFVGLWFIVLGNNFTSSNTTLKIPFVNKTINLGENENENRSIEKDEEENEDDD